MKRYHKQGSVRFGLEVTRMQKLTKISKSLLISLYKRERPGRLPHFTRPKRDFSNDLKTGTGFTSFVMTSLSTKCKQNYKYILAGLCLLIIIAGAVSCRSAGKPAASTNGDVLNYQDFFLSAEEVGLTTFTRGTAFVRGDRDNPEEMRVQIAARVEIDTADFGGVSFNIPQGWKAETVVSDYPQGNPNPEIYTVTLQTADETVTWPVIVEVGRTSHGAGAGNPQGGTGNLIIELSPAVSGGELPEDIDILIAAGSREPSTVDAVHETFSVPLHPNNRTTGSR